MPQERKQTGGEPDAVARDAAIGEVLFFDCRVETPKGRRSWFFDREGVESCNEHSPKDSALDMAAAIGGGVAGGFRVSGLSALGEFDQKTSRWVKTSEDLKKRGGALFGVRRYGRVFLYHNGAQTYFGVRRFQGSVRV